MAIVRRRAAPAFRCHRPAMLLAGAALLASCETIQVQPGDSSVPELGVTLVAATSLAAQYTDGVGERVVARIAPDRAFRIRLVHPRQRVGLLFHATDIETGIQSGAAQVDMRFRCLYLYPNSATPEFHDSGAVIPAPAFGSPAAVGATTSPSAGTGLSFDLEILWAEGLCSGWAPRPRPYRRGIGLDTVRYSVSASNNGTGGNNRSSHFTVDVSATTYLDP